MAVVTRTRTECDVFGTCKDVKKYEIVVRELDAETGQWEEWYTSVPLDLSPRGLDRLKKFITRGTTPPSQKEESCEKEEK